ncbi:MAG: hypothetical protein AAGC60_21175 [Acidobacteriota bacterium]
MNRDFQLNQGIWLGDYAFGPDPATGNFGIVAVNVVDRQRQGGVCHAMSTEWLFAQLNGRPWNVQQEYWRAVSHQRAYAIYWQDALRGHWGGGHYQQYLQIALRPTRDYVANPARRQHRNFHSARVASLNFLRFHIADLGVNSGFVIVMFGVDNNDNWGHTVAIHRDGGGTYRFVDVNFGQYSWPGGTAGLQVGQETRQFLHQWYGNDGIRDVYLFRVG